MTGKSDDKERIAQLTKDRDEWKHSNGEHARLADTHAFRAEAAEAEVARLRAALRDQFCPRPCNGRPDQFDVGDCVDAGECGCSAAPALAFQERA